MRETDVLTDIRERVVRIETLLENQEKIRKNVEELDERTQEQGKKLVEMEERTKTNGRRLNKLESNSVWLWRTIVGAVVTAALGMLIIFYR